jgi:hypothetical protein
MADLAPALARIRRVAQIIRADAGENQDMATYLRAEEIIALVDLLEAEPPGAEEIGGAPV